jgi:hypothetical protein
MYSSSANSYGAAIVNVYQDPTLNIKSATVQVQSDPLGVEPDDEFGFSESITEWNNGTSE